MPLLDVFCVLILQAFGTADVRTEEMADGLGSDSWRGWTQLGVALAEVDCVDEGPCEEF